MSWSSDVADWHFRDIARSQIDFRFFNRPFGIKRLQTIHHYSIDVAHGLVGQDPESQFGPIWDIKQRLILQWRSCLSPYQNAPLSQ